MLTIVADDVDDADEGMICMRSPLHPTSSVDSHELIPLLKCHIRRVALFLLIVLDVDGMCQLRTQATAALLRELHKLSVSLFGSFITSSSSKYGFELG